jgi:hypothetical protein
MTEISKYVGGRASKGAIEAKHCGYDAEQTRKLEEQRGEAGLEVLERNDQRGGYNPGGR